MILLMNTLAMFESGLIQRRMDTISALRKFIAYFQYQDETKMFKAV